MQLLGRPATELADAVRAGRATAVEVVTAHLDHLDAVDGRLGAYVRVRGDDALEEAAEVDARSDRGELPLAGVPVAIKDVADVAGEATRHGSVATPGRPVEVDDEVVARLRAAGAVVVGKTRCPELALWGTSDDVAGAAVSPWDATRTAGGSSGGSAAAVSAGTVPIALASDGLGSIRIPAAATGCVGIKPGAGRAPVIGPDGEHHWFGMSRYGPIATTVADAALMLDVLSGTDDLRTVRRPTDERLRVAVSVASPAPGVRVAPAWWEVAAEAGRLLRHAGHRVARVDPPYDPASLQAVTDRWTQGAAAEVDARGLDPDLLQPRTRTHAGAGRRLQRFSPVRAEQAKRWRDRVAPLLAANDVLVTPTFARSQPAADPWHRRGWGANVLANLSAYPFTGPWNLADVPAVAVPLGHDHGRPASVQIVAAPGREDLVLSVAAELEAMVGRARHAPGWGMPVPV